MSQEFRNCDVHLHVGPRNQVWVDINGQCRLRVQAPQNIVVEDEREYYDVVTQDGTNLTRIWPDHGELVVDCINRVLHLKPSKVNAVFNSAGNSVPMGKRKS